MSDTLSFLTHSTLPLAKTWKPDGSIQDYSKPKNFKLNQFTFHNIKELSAFLSKIEHKPNTCLIRGKYIGNTPEHTMRRKDVFADQELHMILVEIDQHVPQNIDPVLDPVKAIEAYILSSLPECFHGASYHWQLSNSAGHPSKAGILKAHIYFWLTESYTSAQLKAWAENSGTDKVLDVATLDPVQVHYTALPVFETSVKDPVPLRSGFVEGLISDDVDLILDPDSLAAKAKDRPKEQTYQDDDLTALWLQEQGIAKGEGPNGQILITCPFSDEHTDGRIGESDTTYLLAGTGGFNEGVFHCSHNSCHKRESSEFESAFGSAAAYFDILPPEEITSPPKDLKRFDPIQAGDFASFAEPEWIIEDVVPQAELGVIFGATGSRKTFLALDIALAIATGREWNGKETKQGPVLYICAEGANDFRIRLRAYARQFNINLKGIPFYVIGNAPNMLVKEDVTELLKAIKSLGNCAAVFIDTLAQTTAGGDENSGKDMTRALANCKALHKQTNGIVILIHHAGKDLTKGSRGWSGVKAAADFEMEVTDNGNKSSTLVVTKQKGGEAGLTWTVRALPIVVGTSKKGKDITSLYVEYSQASGISTDYKLKKRTFWQQIMMDAFEHFGGGQELISTVTEEAIRSAPGIDAPRKKRYKARQALENLALAGEIIIKDGVISRPL